MRQWTSLAEFNSNDTASKSANCLTKMFKQYCTSIKIGHYWYITNRFDPRAKK